MDKKTIMEMNKKWKDFRLQEASKIMVVKWSAGKNYYWRNKDIIIITANNPITGQYYAPDRRSPEKNYASYVGIETRDQKTMDKVVKLFKQNTSYRKGESKGRRDFV
jgi:predicted transglutaminase-like protease